MAEINFLEICNTLKLDSTELYNNVCEQMEKVLKEEFSNQYNSTNVEENKQQISQNLFSDSTKFFIDNNNKLNVTVQLELQTHKTVSEKCLNSNYQTLMTRLQAFPSVSESS